MCYRRILQRILSTGTYMNEPIHAFLDDSRLPGAFPIYEIDERENVE